MDGVERALRCSCISIFIMPETKRKLHSFQYSSTLLLLAGTCYDYKQAAGGSAATCIQTSLVFLNVLFLLGCLLCKHPTHLLHPCWQNNHLSFSKRHLWNSGTAYSTIFHFTICTLYFPPLRQPRQHLQPTIMGKKCLDLELGSCSSWLLLIRHQVGNIWCTGHKTTSCL